MSGVIVGMMTGMVYVCWIVFGIAFPFGHFLFEWQELIGSLFGAAIAGLVAVGLFFATEISKDNKDFRSHIHLLHRSVGAALSNLVGIDKALHNFVETTLDPIIRDVESKIKEGTPCLNQAFIPLMYSFEFDTKLLETFSGSGYIDVKTLLVIGSSKDLSKLIQDLNRQFDATLEQNNQITLRKLNTNHVPANTALKDHLLQFKKMLETSVFEKAIPLYVRELTQTQVAVGKLQEFGSPKKWRDFFKAKNFDGPDMEKNLDQFFSKEVTKKLLVYQSQFTSPLMLVE